MTGCLSQDLLNESVRWNDIYLIPSTRVPLFCYARNYDDFVKAMAYTSSPTYYVYLLRDIYGKTLPDGSFDRVGLKVYYEYLLRMRCLCSTVHVDTTMKNSDIIRDCEYILESFDFQHDDDSLIEN